MAVPDRDVDLRLGVFGGTFDPPHIGHVAVARDVADRLHLDRVLWIPAGVPPHKTDRSVSPAGIRVEMTRAAVVGEPRFDVSEIEIRRAGPSYTVDTLRELRREHPDTDLFLILGVDQLRVFTDTWREPRAVLDLATLVRMDRAGEDALDVGPRLPGMERSVHVPVTRVDISSSEVRALVAAGADVSALVPPGVLAVMNRERLYLR